VCQRASFGFHFTFPFAARGRILSTQTVPCLRDRDLPTLTFAWGRSLSWWGISKRTSHCMVIVVWILRWGNLKQMLIFKIKAATSSGTSWSYFSFKTYLLPPQRIHSILLSSLNDVFHLFSICVRVVLRRCYGLFCFFRYLSAIPTCCREKETTHRETKNGTWWKMGDNANFRGNYLEISPSNPYLL